jgi:hypothetical protein
MGIQKTHFNMKTVMVIFLLLGGMGNMHAQEKAVENFRKELNFFIDFQLGKIDAVKRNEANYIKYRKRVDQAFRAFVLDSNSHRYKPFITYRGNRKFFTLDNRIEVYLSMQMVNNVAYAVYSFVSAERRAYLVKDMAKNSIVYGERSLNHTVDSLYAIDDKHILLVEKDGDRGTSRKAIVLSAKQRPWKPLQAFRGLAFGQVPADYFKKVFTEKRESFQLDCEFDELMLLPQDANHVSFDDKTKTLSYKRYSDSRKFVVITAKWENGIFRIDDYSVREQVSGHSPAVPNR